MTNSKETLKKSAKPAKKSSTMPGPADYSVKTTIGKEATDPSIEKNPAYSILARRPNNFRAFGPGPAYDVGLMNQHGKHRVPGGPFGARLDGQKKASTPGPADYCVRPIKTTVGVRIVRPRGRPPVMSSTPGPDAYTLPDMRTKRAATLAKRLDRGAQRASPGFYLLPHGDLYLDGHSRQGRTMAQRLGDPLKCRTPGPADYLVGSGNGCCRVKALKQGTFGSRRSDTMGIYVVPEDNDCETYNC